MKRVIALLFVAAILCSGAIAEVYDGEILFRGIPWLIDVEAFSEQVAAELSDTPSEAAQSLYNINAVRVGEGFVYYPEKPSSREETTMLSAGFQFTVGLIRDDVLVAGYPISHVSGCAFYGVNNGVVSKDLGDSKVVNARYAILVAADSDVPTAFNDINAKLTTLYGAPADSWYTENDGMRKDFARRLGADGTYVTLSSLWKIPDNTAGMLNIEYGTLKAADLAVAIQNPESTIDRASTDGL